MHRIIDLLNKQAEAIRRLEREGDRVLLQENDRDQYRSCLLEKVELLSDLQDKARPCLQDLDPRVRQEIETVLRGFAQRAEQAMALDSLFFMRRLLHPEDSRDDEENELEAFSRTLAGRS